MKGRTQPSAPRTTYSARARCRHRHPAAHLEVEHPRRVEPEDLRALLVAKMRHLALDRFRRMRPRSFVMRIVIGPHEVAAQVVLRREVKSGSVLLERCETVAA